MYLLKNYRKITLAMKKHPPGKGMSPGYGIWRFDSDWKSSTADLLGCGVALAIILGTILLCALGVI